MFRSIKTDLRFVDETLHDCTDIDPPPPIPHTQCTSELIRAHAPPLPRPALFFDMKAKTAKHMSAS